MISLLDKENISPNFNKAIGILQKKQDPQNSSSKKNRKSLSRLFPQMTKDTYKIDFGSEAK